MVTFDYVTENALESKKTFNNGNFNYKWVIDVTDMDNATGDTSQGKWMATLSAVKTPKYLTKEQLADVANTCGIPQADVTCFDIASVGICANINTMMGNNKSRILSTLKKEADIANLLFGFYMDRPLNAIGSTGWDFINGDFLAGLRK
jgi:hypothetical protein